MHVFITGGHGLVGANIALHVLATRRGAHVTLMDLDAPDAVLAAALAPHGDRITVQRADIRHAETWAGITTGETITHVVHAAAVTHLAQWERERPERFFDVNVDGTIAVMQFCRRLPRLRRILHLSTGGVYGEPTRFSPLGPQDEDGPFAPPELYAISKFAAERTAQRLGALFDLDVRALRPSAVFGPFERPTGGRRSMSLPHALAHAVAHDRPLRLTRRSLDAGGDFVSGPDLADAAVRLLEASGPRHFAYNVAGGRFTTVRELLALATETAPGLRCELAEAADPSAVDLDPTDRLARFNAYSIERIAADCGWRPRPLAEQLHAYLRWVADDAGARVLAS